MKIDVPKRLIEAVHDRKVIPFVGAGFSKNLGLPDWSEVTNMIAKELGFDPAVCATYGDYLQIAEYYLVKKGSISALRSRLDKLLNSASIDVASSAPHMLLPKLNARIVYTTNWDGLIERAYDKVGIPFNKVASLEDLRDVDESKTTIIKFHGDFSGSDEDIVLTESSYLRRLDFESPLDLKLRADVLSNIVLFIGYSFSDLNLRYLWYKLSCLSDGVRRGKDEPLGYIVTAKPNPIFEIVNKERRGIEVIPLDPVDPRTSLKHLMEALVAAL